MSLDVTLWRKRQISYDEGKTYMDDNEEVFSSNITHNLGEMAEKAGIYEALWRPYRLKQDYVHSEDYVVELKFEDNSEITANEIIPFLEKGLAKLKSKPKYYQKFNSPNGWGLYEDFVPVVEEYLEACKEYPNSTISISR